MGNTQLSGARDWWRGAVIYQIYPRSFQDSTGDGVGDLAGITRRLDYVASIGVDAVWISPFFTSPMRDFGYDVSDYCDVDPMFGTLEDFDQLVARAHALGLRVMIDLVLSHSSDQHPWFSESRADTENPKNNWYVWADAKPDGTPPNNWLSIFGGSAWQWDARRCQYYLHNFLASQPDLNFHEPQVQEALLRAARFWLERGVDGFRLDTINFYFADKVLRDNPPLPPEARNATIAPAVNPYNHQWHVYSKNQPENIEFLAKFRKLMDQFGAAAVGEVGDAQRGLELLGEYTRGSTGVQMCYAFEFLSKTPLNAARLAEVFGELDRVAGDGWACWAFSNHDVERHASRWQLNDAGQRLFILLIACLRGSLCIYQGEELGLPEADVPFEALQDPYGIEFWPEFKGRDGCRTPMVWSASNTNGGFTTGVPWLPVDPAHLGRAVEPSEADAGALLHHYRGVLALRRAHPGLVRGAQSPIRAQGDVASFTRSLGAQRYFCAFNMGSQPAQIPHPAGTWRALAGDLGARAPDQSGAITLAPWQACILHNDDGEGDPDNG